MDTEKDGDYNIKDFHATLTERRAGKTISIRRIKDESGTCGSLHQKKRQAELYFINLVGTASRVEGLYNRLGFFLLGIGSCFSSCAYLN